MPQKAQTGADHVNVLKANRGLIELKSQLLPQIVAQWLNLRAFKFSLINRFLQKVIFILPTGLGRITRRHSTWEKLKHGMLPCFPVPLWV